MKTKKALPKILFWALLIFIIQSFYLKPISDFKDQQLIAKSNLYNMRFPQEKLYLHVDRASYWANEDIWYKAYLLNSPIPDCNLYVELINSSGTVILKNISFSEGGLAYGDFHLADTISSGVYQLRAYTNWMRNFDDCWFFRKNLVIWNLRDKELKTDSVALKPKNVDLQFFPESGIFLANIKNRVAFKSVDQNGKGLNVTGEVINSQGEKVTSFESIRNGIGSFEMVPKSGQKYVAKVTVANNIQLKVDLPEAQAAGIAMNIESAENQIHFHFQEKNAMNSADSNSEYMLTGQARGLIFFQKEIKLNSGNGLLDLDKSKIPAGIAKFTLFDKQMIPCCERLVFINQLKSINVLVVTNKSEYDSREKVEVDIQLFTQSGTPCLSNLSMAVINPDSQFNTSKYPNNILTQFLLGSELKGTIEDPAWYLKDDSLTTQIALDNLMLTHGYRQFEWKEIREDQYPEIKYQPESSIQLRGKVTSSMLGVPVQAGKVTLMTVKSLLSVKEQMTDSLGQFLFSDLYFNDTLEVSLHAVNQKGRKNTWIELDKKSAISPPEDILPYQFHFGRENSIVTTSYLSELSSDLINRKWRLSDTILLGDVNIQAYKKKKDDGLFRMYKEADFVFDMAKQDDVSGNVFDAIDGRIPGVRYELSENAFYFRGKPVLIYLDGIRVDDNEFISTFPSQSFDKIELVKMGTFAGINYQGGILFFYSKRGRRFEHPPTDAIGMKSARIIGYSVVRKFYSPQYDAPDLPAERKDFRSTLYWNPVVKTDSTGLAQVGFYNSDEAGQMLIVVEGITVDGKLCRGLCRYNVTAK